MIIRMCRNINMRGFSLTYWFVSGVSSNFPVTAKDDRNTYFYLLNKP